ncbi:thioredoxin dependent peroxidase [Haematococcus lacustris]
MLAKGVRAGPRVARNELASATSIRRVRASRLAVLVKAELKVGDKMSDYADYYRVLNRSDGGAVSISSFQGKKPVVLFFYPKAGTPGCTKEACKFRDEYQRFEEAGAAVFGISSDSPDVNAAFAKEQGLQFPLLTDGNSILRKTFGIKADLLGLLPGRQTYVIDINGKVILSFNDQFNAEQHVSMALNALQNAKAMA